MKKYFSIMLCAIMIGVSVFSTPVKAGYDRKYGTCGDAEIWAYCSTGAPNNPAGYCAETSAPGERSLKISITFHISGESSARSRSTGFVNDFYTFLEGDDPVTYMYSHHYVGTSYQMLYVDAE